MKNKPWWMCDLEEFFGFQLKWDFIHDGQHSPDRYAFPPDEVKCFTRRYRGGNEEIVFFYDLRGKPSCKFEFYNHPKRKDKFVLKRQHDKGRRDIFNSVPT